MNINFNNLVRQLLPHHKRQNVRLQILQAFVKPLATALQALSYWQDSQRMAINVNSQLKVLEGYLRVKYNQPIGIKIVNYQDGLLLVSLQVEDTLKTYQPPFGKDSEQQRQEIPLEGEVRQSFGDVDFIIYIPLGVDKEAIKADIEKYKQVLITYKIIQK